MNNLDSVLVNNTYNDLINQVIFKDVAILFISFLVIYYLIRFAFQFIKLQSYSPSLKAFFDNNSYVIQISIWLVSLTIVVVFFLDYTINSNLILNLFFIFLIIFLSLNMIKNVYSGLLIYINKTFSVGDTIQLENNSGVVKRIGIRSVHLLTEDHTEIIIPHSKVLDQTISKISDKIESSSTEFNIKVNSNDSNNALRVLKLAAYSSPYLDYSKDVELFVEKIDAHNNEVSIRMHVYAYDHEHASALKSDIIKNSSIYFNDHNGTA